MNDYDAVEIECENLKCLLADLLDNQDQASYERVKLLLTHLGKVADYFARDIE